MKTDKVFIDSNVLVSAARNPNGKPFLAFLKAITFPNVGVICDQNIDEIRRVFNRKFPNQIPLLEHFLAEALPFLLVVSTPTDEIDDEEKIRDVSDRPILRAAIAAGVDILITGDKDFLESNVSVPRIMTIAEFLDMAQES
ncbi:MAG: putative toxin-antitoxin system toxin component, PIN family [Chitinispirillales bacterium]|nr:putative toxin-antitoxin system toxin component, PIN family [Chitinispirillales bacterium]